MTTRLAGNRGASYRRIFRSSVAGCRVRFAGHILSPARWCLQRDIDKVLVLVEDAGGNVAAMFDQYYSAEHFAKSVHVANYCTEYLRGDRPTPNWVIQPQITANLESAFLRRRTHVCKTFCRTGKMLLNDWTRNRGVSSRTIESVGLAIQNWNVKI